MMSSNNKYNNYRIKLVLGIKTDPNSETVEFRSFSSAREKVAREAAVLEVA